MDDLRLTRIETKIDDLSEHLSSIDVTLGKQHVSLEDHIRRTNMLEKEIRPVVRHKDRMEGALKLVALASMLAAIAEFFLHK